MRARRSPPPPDFRASGRCPARDGEVAAGCAARPTGNTGPFAHAWSADVSFFDDEPDEPTRVTRPARPRRAATAAGVHRPEPEIARRRQFVLFGGLALIALLLLFTVRSCAGNRHKNALKDYNREVASIVQSSDDQVSKQLFDVLGGGGGTQDVQVTVNQVRLVAEEDAKRARALNVPGDVAAAQRN